MIEGRMNGVAEAHHGHQTMFSYGYPITAFNANFVKETAHFGRQLPPEIKVTSAGYHSPYVGADHHTPINLVQKDLPPETNGYAAPYRNVGPPPFGSIFPYSSQSLIAGPYTPHQQVPSFTPHRSPYSTPTSTPIAIPISRPGIDTSPVDVKTSSSASVNGENHAFKKPDEGSSRYYSSKCKPRKRQVHVPTPAPVSVSVLPPTTTVTSVHSSAARSSPVVLEQSPLLHQQQSTPALQPTLNETAELSEMDRFCAGHMVYFGLEKIKKNLTPDEYFALVDREELIPIEKLTTEHWQRMAKNSDKELLALTVKRISENQKAGKVRYLLLYGNQSEFGVLELEFERPLFAFGRGWTSYLPDRTRERCKGLQCSKINEGDVVLILTPKKRKRAEEEARAIVDLPPKKHRLKANNENDSNNNEATPPKRKKSAEEASNKARRWSDSCLEKTS